MEMSSEYERNTEERRPLIARERTYSESLNRKDVNKKILLIWKDILVLSFASASYMFSPGTYLFNLNTLYADPKLVFSVFSMYSVGIMVTSFFFPTLLITKLGCKKVLIMATASPIIFSVGQYYPSVWTFLIGGFFLGFGSICQWVAIGTYVSEVGTLYCTLRQYKMEVVLSILFGIVYCIGFVGAVAGNVILHEIMKADEPGSFNSTTITNGTCGPEFCISEPREPTMLTETVAIALTRRKMSWVCMCISAAFTVVAAVFLNRRRELETFRQYASDSFSELLMANVMAVKDEKMRLLSVTCVVLGSLPAFAGEDFTEGFIMCSVGKEQVSLISSFNIASFAVSTLIGGAFVKYFGVIFLMMFTNFASKLVYVLLLLWMPNESSFLLLLLVDAWLGIAMGIYNNLINTLIGLHFPRNREASFAMFRFFYGLGSLLQYVCSSFLCMKYRIAFLIAICCLSTITYLWLEVVLRRTRKIVTNLDISSIKQHNGQG